MNVTETKKAIERISLTKSLFLGRLKDLKNGKTLARFIKKKKGKGPNQ